MGKQRRLRKGGDFARVRQTGRSYASGRLVLTVAAQSAAADGPGAEQLLALTRVGLSVSARVGDAVTRNRVRRRLRELLRAHLVQTAPGWDIIVGARAAAAASSFQALDLDLTNLLARAKVLAPGSEATPL